MSEPYGIWEGVEMLGCWVILAVWCALFYGLWRLVRWASPRRRLPVIGLVRWGDRFKQWWQGVKDEARK